MFYIGYYAKTYGTRAINVSLIPSTIEIALDHCKANPNRTVASAFAAAYAETARW